MTRPLPTYPGPTQDQLRDLLELTGWSRTDLAREVRVGKTTVDHWLAATRASPMPAGLYELAMRKLAGMRK